MKILCSVLVLVSVVYVSAAPFDWRRWSSLGSLGSGNGVGNFNTDGGNHGNGLGNNNGPRVNNVENYNGYNGKNGPGYKEIAKPTAPTIYNGRSGSSEEGGKHNGKDNKGGFSGHYNTGDYNGNRNEGGVNGNWNRGSYNGNNNKGGYNGNGNGGSGNGNGNVGGGMNGNGNGGDGEVDWQSFLNGFNRGNNRFTTPGSEESTEGGYEPGFGPNNWRKYLTTDGDDETTAAPARRTTPYATRRTTTDAYERVTAAPAKQTTEKVVEKATTEKMTDGDDYWDNQNWGGLDQDYWDNFNKQFQPGGRYHWRTYLNNQNYGNYGNFAGKWWDQ